MFQVDAFSTTPFRGNPAAVCLLEQPLHDQQMQQIAAENNLSETAFILPGAPHPTIRWFTPTTEVDLCGHATLASAWVWLHHVRPQDEDVIFESPSGPLTIWRAGAMLRMRLPLRSPEPCALPDTLRRGLDIEPSATLAANAYLAVYTHADQVRALRPDMDVLRNLDREGVIATAPANTDDLDFVSRYFVPSQGIDEDPVTGSTHCVLTPYWAERLGKRRLRARQCSARGGELLCELGDDHVDIHGAVSPYLEGTITLPATT